MKVFLPSIILLLCHSLAGQFVVDFENFNLEIDDSIVQGDGGFYSGNMFFPNQYFEEGGYFTDWAISSMTDTLSAGPGNALSAYAGGGKASITYAVASAFSPVRARLIELDAGKTMTGMYVTNNTYAALSMLNGDAFAKKFGGESGNDPDFFKLTIKKWLNGELGADSIDVFLADFRFEDASLDYIVKEWVYVDLESLGGVDSLEFSLSSSDVGAFGMNTPAFFCIDNVLVGMSSAIDQATQPNREMLVYPNPASEYITLDILVSDATILSSEGSIVKQVEVTDGKIYTGDLLSGLYFIQTINGIARFVKI